MVTGSSTTIPVSIDSNIPISISVSDSWVTLPASQAPAGQMSVPVAIAANPGVARTATITAANAEYGFTQSYTISQYACGVVFQDDFEWMGPIIDASGVTVNSSVEENTDSSAGSPNLYTKAELRPLLNELIARGYDDLNPAAKVVYPQRNYFKFGKTGNNTGLRLPSTCPSGDAEISFDWSPHMKGASTYAIDPVDIVVEIEGTGKVVTAAGPASVSDPTGFTWETHQLGWKRATFQLQGLSPSDRIIIRPQNMTVGSKVVNRWYVDNISIVTK